jgi:hypothetical protein
MRGRRSAGHEFGMNSGLAEGRYVKWQTIENNEAGVVDDVLRIF